MAKFFLFPALIKSVQNCPMASEPLIGCTPGGIKMASLVYSAGNAFPFMLLYAADHSLFAASIAALILSWPHAVGAVNSYTKIAEEIACFIFTVFSPVCFSTRKSVARRGPQESMRATRAQRDSACAPKKPRSALCQGRARPPHYRSRSSCSSSPLPLSLPAEKASTRHPRLNYPPDRRWQ